MCVCVCVCVHVHTCVHVCVCACVCVISRDSYRILGLGGKTRLCNHLSDSNLEHLKKIAIEGRPSISNVDFNEIFDILKQKNRH